MKPQGIHFQPLDITCEIADAESVLDVALRNGIEISHSCGGMGSCTTCRILIERSNQALPPRNELEQDIADMRNFDDRERLACQLPPVAGLVVRIPDSLPEESST
jgi:2Fe-2S ferredoxin